VDRYRLKNVIIVILALLNVFLLISLVLQEKTEQTTHHRMEEQLILLFAADGMTLEEGTLLQEKPPAILTMSRDAERETAVAEFFLGQEILREDQGGGIVSFSGTLGTAQFRENGGFEVSAKTDAADPEELCRRFCQKFSYAEPTFLPLLEGSTATAAALHDGRQVINCRVRISCEDGSVNVQGTLLPESGTAAASDGELLSAAAALTAFQNTRRETGAVVSAVTETALCYRLQSSPASPISLVPVWCIVTDTSKYYVNCSTGAVTTE